MIILKTIIIWLISTLVAWLVWGIFLGIAVGKLGNEESIKFNNFMSDYPKNELKSTEWIRFICWPYGIVQRTILVAKLFKEFKKESNQNIEG